MRRLAVTLLCLAAVAMFAVAAASAVEVDSKAQKITFTGRVQPMWSYTSDDGPPSNQFLLRRARMAMKLKINDWVSGMVEADFGQGATSLKDGYFKAEPLDDFEIIAGQTKRRFDLFELPASPQILVIERDGRIGDRRIPSYSFLTEDLGFADRDIGLFLGCKLADEMVKIDAAVTNGAGENTKPTIGEKAYQARVSLAPLRETDLEINVGISAKPFEKTGTEVGYASAFEVSMEYGDYDAGPHVQAGFVGGKNWKDYVASTDDTPTFMAFQGIATYKHELANAKWFESIEPLVRVSWADPNRDADKDDGLLVTPGVNFFVVSRTRLSVDADIFMPAADDIPSTTLDESATALGLKVASWLYF
jgi:hypothetical protein